MRVLFHVHLVVVLGLYTARKVYMLLLQFECISGRITAPHTGLAWILHCFESVSNVCRYYLKQRFAYRRMMGKKIGFHDLSELLGYWYWSKYDITQNRLYFWICFANFLKLWVCHECLVFKKCFLLVMWLWEILGFIVVETL